MRVAGQEFGVEFPGPGLPVMLHSASLPPSGVLRTCTAQALAESQSPGWDPQLAGALCSAEWAPLTDNTT